MDEATAHRFFSSKCFNDTWGLLDKADRTPEDDRLMREMAHASLLHWLRRQDCEPKNLSIGLWLVSRVYATLGDGANAARYAEECIAISEGLGAFELGYGFEAAARAAQLLEDRGAFDAHLDRAKELLEEVGDAEEKKLLGADLEELSGGVK